jgi:hypothetical protein
VLYNSGSQNVSEEPEERSRPELEWTLRCSGWGGAHGGRDGAGVARPHGGTQQMKKKVAWLGYFGLVRGGRRWGHSYSTTMRRLEDGST